MSSDTGSTSESRSGTNDESTEVPGHSTDVPPAEDPLAGVGSHGTGAGAQPSTPAPVTPAPALVAGTETETVTRRAPARERPTVQPEDVRKNADTATPGEARPTTQPGDILKDAGSATPPARLLPLQWVATIFAGFLGLTLLLLIGQVAYHWSSIAPRPPTTIAAPSPVPEASPGAMATAIADYRVLNEVAVADYKARGDVYQNQMVGFIDAVAIKLVIPLVTLLLGYLSGIRKKEACRPRPSPPPPPRPSGRGASVWQASCTIF